MTNQMIQPVHHAVTVSATPEDAFRIFTERMGQWWPREHSIGETPKDDEVMELHAGGTLWEIGADGSRCRVGCVLAWDPPHRLVVSWEITPQWTPMETPDPAHASEYEATFVDLGNGRTKVDIVHRHFDRHGGDGGNVIRRAVDGGQGWPYVLEAYADHVQHSRS